MRTKLSNLFSTVIKQFPVKILVMMLYKIFLIKLIIKLNLTI